MTSAPSATTSAAVSADATAAAPAAGDPAIVQARVAVEDSIRARARQQASELLRRATRRLSATPEFRSATRTRLDPYLAHAGTTAYSPDAAVTAYDRQRLRAQAHQLYATSPLARAAV